MIFHLDLYFCQISNSNFLIFDKSRGPGGRSSTLLVDDLPPGPLLLSNIKKLLFGFNTLVSTAEQNPDPIIIVLIIIVYIYGGERGIRTLETFDSLHTFQAC